MNLLSLPKTEIAALLKKQGLFFFVGSFVIKVNSRLPSVVDGLFSLYADYELADESYADFHIEINPPKNFRRWYRPQVDFYFDGYRPFKPLPQDQAFALFEWSFNWCVASHCHTYLILHAAVIEKNGHVVIMPAPPGSGKSTLTAGLVSRGWRLLSDELAMLSLDSENVIPLPRPVSLKNESIDIMKEYAPGSVLGPIAHDTSKGAVAHMKAPRNSVMRGNEPAAPRWVIFPKYQANQKAVLEPMNKAQAFMDLAENAFNYQILRQRAFEKLGGLIDDCQVYRFAYNNLDDALDVFNRLD